MFRGPMARTVILGVRSLLLHKLRSTLTALGILFGVSSVIAMLSIGEGGSYESQREILAMGSSNVILQSRKPANFDDKHRGENSTWKAQSYGLEYADAECVVATLPAVDSVIPIRQIPKRAAFEDRSKQVQVIGTVEGYRDVAGVSLGEGRFISQLDEDRRRNVCVLGAGVARDLFPFSSPLDVSLRLGSEVFRVVGVLSDPEFSSGGAESVQALQGVFVPLSAARKFFGELTVKSSTGSREFERVELHRVIVRVRSNDDVIATSRALQRLMDQRHSDDDVKMTVPLELLRQAEKTQRIFSIVLGSVAAISLLVGGIGIMNVMLATVTERTREIGVRRALGARRHHILYQFLVETLVLSCGGGLLGIGLGFAIPEIVTRFTDLKTIVLPQFPIVAFAISVAVGVGFGIYPAWRAASMDPVVALRHE